MAKTPTPVTPQYPVRVANAAVTSPNRVVRVPASPVQFVPAASLKFGPAAPPAAGPLPIEQTISYNASFTGRVVARSGVDYRLLRGVRALIDNTLSTKYDPRRSA